MSASLRARSDRTGRLSTGDASGRTRCVRPWTRLVSTGLVLSTEGPAMRAVRPLVRRSLVAAIALATAAAAIPVLGGPSASAAATTGVSLGGPTHGAAGSCLSYAV